MDKAIPPSVLTPLKPPRSFHTPKPVDKKKYLDEFFTRNWLDNYFNKISNK
jgi:hypothetical protein